MESIEDKIIDFVSISSGSGSGDGYGSGYGSGDGSGSGDGYGSGDGSGSGYGSGHGSGDGSGSGDGYGDGSSSGSGSGYGSGYGGISNFNNNKVHLIDGMLTIIYSVRGNYAKGEIINNDLTTSSVFIAKKGDYFAHGRTLKAAIKDALYKFNENLPLEDRIKSFKEKVKGLEVIPNKILFEWHTILTGSCATGKEVFLKDNNIDLNGSTTLDKFIDMTKNSYGREAIIQLEKSIQIN